MPEINKILVANRGEIALRVMRTAREMGLQTVAIHSPQDAQAAHVRFADEAYFLDGEAAAENYLNIDRIVETCEAAGADAVLGHVVGSYAALRPADGGVCGECCWLDGEKPSPPTWKPGRPTSMPAEAPSVTAARSLSGDAGAGAAAGAGVSSSAAAGAKCGGVDTASRCTGRASGRWPSVTFSVLLAPQPMAVAREFAPRCRRQRCRDGRAVVQACDLRTL